MPTRHYALAPDESAALVFQSFEIAIPKFGILVDNGLEVDQAAWAAIAYAKFENSDGTTGGCTATLVGPRVVLTAAHCLNSARMNARIEFTHAVHGMTCAQHPEYAAARDRPRPPNDDADYALCLLDQAVESVAYEVIDMERAPAKDQLLTLTGYGCIEMSVSAVNELRFTESEGVLRIGADKVYMTDFSLLTHEPGSTFLTAADVDGDPTICPGDSGGPAFVIDGGVRRVHAVNSAFAWNGTGDNAVFFSSLAPLGHAKFRSFAHGWRAENAVPVICGMDAGPGESGCRSAVDPFDLSGGALY